MPSILYTAHASQLETDPRNPSGCVLELEAEGVTLYLSEHDHYALEHQFEMGGDYTADDLIYFHNWVAQNVTVPPYSREG